METVELTRDCEAVQIPGGDTVTLGSGTPVDITHALGGTYTIRAGSGLFRVNPGDADALGQTRGQFRERRFAPQRAVRCLSPVQDLDHRRALISARCAEGWAWTH